MRMSFVTIDLFFIIIVIILSSTIQGYLFRGFRGFYLTTLRVALHAKYSGTQRRHSGIIFQGRENRRGQTRNEPAITGISFLKSASCFYLPVVAVPTFVRGGFEYIRLCFGVRIWLSFSFFPSPDFYSLLKERVTRQVFWPGTRVGALVSGDSPSF